MTPDHPISDWRKWIALTPIQREHHLEQLAAEHRLRIYGDELEQAAALQKAGWIAEPQSRDSAVFQFFWRRPGPRGGTVFRSTGCAYGALMRGRSNARP